MNNNNATFRVQSFSLTDKGRRSNNEDFVALFEPSDTQERKASGCIYVVADGVGGAEIGERASKYAAEKVVYEYLNHPEIEPGKRLKQVMAQANRDIFDYADDKDIRMATTMSVAVVFDNSLIVANVGDSRVYLIRGKDVRQVTRDHSLVGELVRGGSMTEAEAMKSKMKNRITRSIGGNEDVRVDVFDPIPLQPDDKIILCTDGLTRYAMKKDFLQLAVTDSAKKITTDLVAFAKKKGHGGADNISVITVIYEPSTDLETVARHSPRPINPEQWEIMQTDLGFNSKKSLRLKTWAFTSLFILGGFAVLIMMINYLLPPQVPAVSTSKNTAIPANYTATNEVPITLPQDTPTATQDNLLPASISSTVIGKVTSESDSVNVTTNPSMDNIESSPLVEKLESGRKFTLIGKFTEDRTWYRIEIANADGEKHFGWVPVDKVEVVQGDATTLPALDYSGVAITPSPIPSFTFTPSPEPSSTPTPTSEPVVSCAYTIESSDNLSGIADKFGIGGNNYKIIVCASNSSGCDLTIPSNILPGWSVIIPGVKESVCTQNGGQPQ
ncbi:MAG: serine/threonine-protein phosphatase [Chloroflexi bacterium]|nr:serine/threonine-protein phosphatase [Chloroflexota bacterium]